MDDEMDAFFKTNILSLAIYQLGEKLRDILRLEDLPVASFMWIILSLCCGLLKFNSSCLIKCCFKK